MWIIFDNNGPDRSIFNQQISQDCKNTQMVFSEGWFYAQYTDECLGKGAYCFYKTSICTSIVCFLRLHPLLFLLRGFTFHFFVSLIRPHRKTLTINIDFELIPAALVLLEISACLSGSKPPAVIFKAGLRSAGISTALSHSYWTFYIITEHLCWLSTCQYKNLHHLVQEFPLIV